MQQGHSLGTFAQQGSHCQSITATMNGVTSTQKNYREKSVFLLAQAWVFLAKSLCGSSSVLRRRRRGGGTGLSGLLLPLHPQLSHQDGRLAEPQTLKLRAFCLNPFLLDLVRSRVTRGPHHDETAEEQEREGHHHGDEEPGAVKVLVLREPPARRGQRFTKAAAGPSGSVLLRKSSLVVLCEILVEDLRFVHQGH